MKHMKRLLALLLMIIMVVCLAGCQNKDTEEKSAAPTPETEENKYKRAQSLFSQNQFAEAAALFDELGGYEDATKLSMYCKAADSGENGDYDTAFLTFESLGDYKESKFMITYYKGRQEESLAFSDHESEKFVHLYRAAYDYYDSIVLFRDSKGRAESCRKEIYDMAVQKAAEGDYDEAKDTLTYLRDYSDSAQLLLYYDALGKEKEGNYAEASQIFQKLNDYKDAAEQSVQVLQRGYDAASALEAAGDQSGAYNLFISLGDYKDSFERACKPYYLMGEEKCNAGDWDGAVEAFTMAGTYSDAETQILATRYAEGEANLEARNYYGAVTAFEKAGTYSDAEAQVNALQSIGDSPEDDKSTNNEINVADSIEGTWKLTGIKSDIPENAEFVSQMEMLLANGLMENLYTYTDGKVTMTAKTNVPGAENQDMTMNGTYTIEGNQLTVIEDGHTGGDPVEFRIDGDTLELITPEMTMTFVRK